MESLGIGCPRRREEIQRDTDKQWDSTSQRIPYRGGKKRSVQGPPVVGGRDLPSAAARGGDDVGERKKRRGSCDAGADLDWSRFQEVGCRSRVGVPFPVSVCARLCEWFNRICKGLEAKIYLKMNFIPKYPSFAKILRMYSRTVCKCFLMRYT